MKRLLSAILTAIMLFVLCASTATLTVSSEDYNDYTSISTAEQFKGIVAGGKYRLTQNIDLTQSGVNFSSLKGGNNNAEAIILDGCGYTVTTNLPLFKELPGGGSEIRNLVINGNISLSDTQAESYSNTFGVIAGKANGGVFENIVNNASISVSGECEARIAGLIGSVFNKSASFKNCTNNGDVSGTVTAASNNRQAVAGFVGYIGVNNVSFVDCANTGDIRNYSTSAEHAFAGGIIGVKPNDSTAILMCDCSNSGRVRANTAYGDYYAIPTSLNINVVNTVPITTAADFAKISGNGIYSLKANITLTSSNMNEFSGVLYGNGYTVTSNAALFAKDRGARLVDANEVIKGLTINGRALSTFSVVASSADDASAKAIVDFVKGRYDITLPIKTASENYVGNAIYINLGNTYGKVRYGLDYGVTDDGYMQVYLDETADNISSYVTEFLQERLTTTSSDFDFFDNFGQKDFRYVFPENASQEIVFNESEDVIRELASGVTYIKRTYTTKNDIQIEAYIVVLKASANAHVEVQAAELTAVETCENDNSDNCLNLHAKTPKSTSTFVAEMESESKNVFAAINAGFFMKADGCYAPWGMQIINGRVDAEPRDNTTKVKNYSNWFGITNDGKPVISTLDGYKSTYKGNILYGVGSRYLCIVDGKYKKLSSSAYDAKTAIGYNANGDIVMLVVSGNNEKPETPGATYSDVAQIFMDLDIDITQAINLDGGGSTTMVVEGTSGKPALESPLLSGSSERKLGNILAIVAD